MAPSETAPREAPKGPRGGVGPRAPNGTSTTNSETPSAPTAPRASNTSSNTATKSEHTHKEPRGPDPGVTLVPAQYTFEQKIRQLQKAVGSDPTREDNYRLQGVQMIDNVRQALQL